MKFTLSWLKQHLETTATLDEIVERLTMIGLEVEGVEDPAAKIEPFRIARVISAERHPNADKLQVCMVDAGDGAIVQVVCGAPNARTGLVSVFSPPGTYIPGKNITLGIGAIRGVESRGMLCSNAELELSEDHDGIIELPADAPLGQSYADYLGLNDPVIDVSLTPNRADCAGIRGIARDLAASGLGTLKPLAPPALAAVGACPTTVTLDLGDDAHWCPTFALRAVKGVRNGPSPDWMQKRLKAIGLRPINTLVDITNYITFDLGRPLHVFDLAKVKGNLRVHHGRDGEELLALDGKTYRFDPSMCAISDENGVESIAGIMGGEVSGCDEATVDVLIESALWDPANVAATGRKHGIVTDARYRFERGVDPEMCLAGLDIATAMVVELAGGSPTERFVAGEVPRLDRVIDFPVDEVRRLSGLDTPVGRMVEILTGLGFAVSGAAPVLRVGVPSWRADVEAKADLVEEVMRIVGVDNIPVTPLPRNGTVAAKVLTGPQIRRSRARRTLAARGMNEGVTWSFISKALAEHFGGGKPELALANPIASDLSDMRPSLLPGLIAAAGRNAARGHGDVAVFEIGQVFFGDRPQDQKMLASGIRRGTAIATGDGRHWSGNAPAVTVFDAKADAIAVLEALGAPVDKLQVLRAAPGWYHPGRSGTLQLGPQVLATFGEVHPATLDLVDVTGPIAAFEVFLDAIPEAKAKPSKSKGGFAVSDLMPLDRDFAFVVDERIEAAALLKAVRGAEKTLITDAMVFDVFRGPAIGEGKKSVAVSVTLQPKDKTLTEADIEAVGKRVVEAAAKATGATLRT
ncbi:MAG: phenylalanine--tRNA ligase subunit beta [Hyphomicrobiaceae bacterium]|nr:phenylalanine--tRNA ligase subunit beta [Hyphomicrobiaceae bacterium]